MKNVFLKTALITSATIVLSACSSSLWNTAGSNPSVAERHPISVDSQVVTMTMDIDPTLNDLSDINRARLKAFGLSYLNGGHGPITVTAPSGGADDLVGQEMAADVREVLHNLGVSYADMTGASYRAGGQANDRQLVVSYTKFVATPSPCGIWNEEMMPRYKNISHPNFGCADQNNLAAMVVDPRDLIEPQPDGPVDTAARVRSIEAYRSGENTASERDGDIETNVAN